MTNSTAIYWDVDGTSLQTYAQNIDTLGGSRSGVPPFRGSDTQFALRRGAKHRPRVADARTLTLGMWVLGVGASDQSPQVQSATQWMANWRALQRLLWRPGGVEFSLTKRWDEGSGVVSATAKAVFESGLEPTMIGIAGARTTVDLHLADPFFYPSQVSTTLNKNTPATINNIGDDTAVKIIAEFNGPLTNPTLTNATPNPDVLVHLGTTISGGDKVIVDVDETTVVRNSDSANLIGTLTHSGARHWMGLALGNNTLTLTADAGSGTVTFKYQVPYF